MANIARTIRHWKGRSIPYRLSRSTQQSIHYLISYTASKRVQINKNMQNFDFRVHLTQQILYV